MTFRDLVLRVRPLLKPRVVEQELDEELNFHLEMEERKLIDAGVPPAEAQIRARARFGSVALAADECRDARGTALLTSVTRDVVYAFRTFKRAPLPALTIIGTLGLGLGLVAVVFTLASPFLFNSDTVPRVSEIVEVRASLGSGDAWVKLTRPQLEWLRRETTALTDPFAMVEDIEGRIDGRMMEGTAVTGNFFRAVGVPSALGRVLTPEDDVRASPMRALVLSDRGWRRRFDADPQVIGRTVLIHGAPFEIVGVMPQGFRGLAIVAPDYWAPLSVIGQLRPADAGHEDAIDISIVGRLRPAVSKSAARDEIAAWFSRVPKPVGAERARIELLERQGNAKLSMEVLVVFAPLVVAFTLILVIACANVANLLLARGVARQREIGIRLSIGATRGRIVRQLLTENVLLALAAAGIGYFVSKALVHVAVQQITGSLPPEVAETISLSAPPSDWRVVLFLIGGAIMSTVVFALSPSLQATRLELVRVIRGEVGRDGQPRRSRNTLIVVQVTAAALLLTCSAVFLRSALAAADFAPGYRTSDTLLIEMNTEARRTAMLRAVESSPLIAAVSSTAPDMLGGARMASVSVATDRLWTSYRFVSPEYMNVFDLQMSRGRYFTASERTRDAAVAIVSETLAHQLRPDGNVLGRVLSVEGAQDERADEPALSRRGVTIVGIRKDIGGFRMIGTGEADLYLPTNATEAKAQLIVRVRGDVDQARRTLLSELTVIDPNMGQLITMKTLARMEVYFLQIGFWVTIALGALALVLTLAGLFSMLSYLVEQRAKEFGVRMTLGANARSIGLLVFSQTFRPVGIGLALGSSLALALAVSIRSISSELTAVVHVLDPVAYATSLSVIIVACLVAALVPARRAVQVDPIGSLRQD